MTIRFRFRGRFVSAGRARSLSALKGPSRYVKTEVITGKSQASQSGFASKGKLKTLESLARDKEAKRIKRLVPKGIRKPKAKASEFIESSPPEHEEYTGKGYEVEDEYEVEYRWEERERDRFDELELDEGDLMEVVSSEKRYKG